MNLCSIVLVLHDQSNRHDAMILQFFDISISFRYFLPNPHCHVPYVVQKTIQFCVKCVFLNAITDQPCVNKSIQLLSQCYCLWVMIVPQGGERRRMQLPTGVPQTVYLLS